MGMRKVPPIVANRIPNTRVVYSGIIIHKLTRLVNDCAESKTYYNTNFIQVFDLRSERNAFLTKIFHELEGQTQLEVIC